MRSGGSKRHIPLLELSRITIRSPIFNLEERICVTQSPLRIMM
jgi:hypothetical protein